MTIYGEDLYSNQNIYTCDGIGSEIKTTESLKLILHFNFDVPDKLKRSVGKYYHRNSFAILEMDTEKIRKL